MRLTILLLAVLALNAADHTTGTSLGVDSTLWELFQTESGYYEEKEGVRIYGTHYRVIGTAPNEIWQVYEDHPPGGQVETWTTVQPHTSNPKIQSNGVGGYRLRPQGQTTWQYGSGYQEVTETDPEFGFTYTTWVITGEYTPPAPQPPQATNPPSSWFPFLWGETFNLNTATTVQGALDSGSVPVGVLSVIKDTGAYFLGGTHERTTDDQYLLSGAWAFFLPHPADPNNRGTVVWLKNFNGLYTIHDEREYGPTGDGGTHDMVGDGSGSGSGDGGGGDGGGGNDGTPPSNGSGWVDPSPSHADNTTEEHLHLLNRNFSAFMHNQVGQLSALWSQEGLTQFKLDDIQNDLGYMTSVLQGIQANTHTMANNAAAEGPGDFESPTIATPADVQQTSDDLATKLDDLPDAADLAGSDTWSIDFDIPWVDGSTETFSLAPPSSDDPWYDSFNGFLLALRIFLTVLMIWAFKQAIITTLRQY